MKKSLLSLPGLLFVCATVFAQTPVSAPQKEASQKEASQKEASQKENPSVPSFVAKTPLYVVPQSVTGAQRIQLAPLAQPSQDFRVSATPLHRGVIKNRKREGELLDTMIVNMKNDFSIITSPDTAKAPPGSQKSQSQSQEKNKLWDNYFGQEMPSTEVGRVWSLFGSSIKNLQDQLPHMRIVFFDTEDPVVRQFAAQGLLKQSENNFVHQTHGLAAFLIKNSKINGVQQNACFIVYDPRFGGHLWRNFIVPFDREGVAQSGTDFLAAHELAHCLDTEEKGSLLARSQPLSSLASLGIAPASWERVAGNKPVTRDNFYAHLMSLSQDTAYQQYQERLADAFAYLWTGRNLPASFDLKRAVSTSRGVQSAYSSHATAPVFDGLSFVGKPVVKDLWSLARRQQVKVGVDPSVVTGPFAGNVATVGRFIKEKVATAKQEAIKSKPDKADLLPASSALVQNTSVKGLGLHDKEDNKTKQGSGLVSKDKEQSKLAPKVPPSQVSSSFKTPVPAKKTLSSNRILPKPKPQLKKEKENSTLSKPPAPSRPLILKPVPNVIPEALKNLQGKSR